MVFAHTDNRAFTLIELVVTVAVIAILLAVLSPVLALARKQVYQFDCASRERQVGKAIIMYAQDYDEGLPVCAAFNRWTNETAGSWDGAVAAYVGYSGPTNEVDASQTGGAIFHCPADVTKRQNGAARSFAMTITGNSCLGQNLGVAGLWTTGPSSLFTKPRFMAEISDSSGTFLLVEFFHPQNRLFGGWAAGIHGPILTEAPCGTGPLAQQRAVVLSPDTGAEPLNHLGGFNYVYCDSHAKWHKPTQTFGPRGTPADPQGPWTVAEND